MAMQNKANWESVVDDSKIEWIGDLPVELGFIVARKRALCEKLGNTFGLAVLDKLYRAWAARGGKRVGMVERIAVREDAIQTATELVSGRRQV